MHTYINMCWFIIMSKLFKLYTNKNTSSIIGFFVCFYKQPQQTLNFPLTLLCQAFGDALIFMNS